MSESTSSTHHPARPRLGIRRLFNSPQKESWQKRLANELWNRPLVLLTGLFAAGLVITDHWQVLLALPFLAALAAVVMGARNNRWAVLCFAILLLISLVWIKWRAAYLPNLDDFLGKAVILQGVVAQEPAPSGVSFLVPLEVEQIECAGKTFALQENISIYLPKEQLVKELDRIEITGKLERIRFAKDPRLTFINVVEAGLLRKLDKKDVGLIERWSRFTKAQVVEVLRPVLPGGYSRLHAQLLGSLFLGATGAGLPDGITDMFRATGTIHVLVVSGTQISLLFALIYLPGSFSQWRQRRAIKQQLRLLGSGAAILENAAYLRGISARLPSPLVILFALALMCLYALITLGGESVARAALMAGLIGLVYFLRHFAAISDHHALVIDRYSLLAAAAVGILMLKPEAIHDIGFQLSFAAVAGILFLAPKMRPALFFMNDFWAYLIAASVSAQLATLPIIAVHFGRVPMIGFFSNIIVVPIAALLLWLGLAAYALGMISGVLAWPFGWACAKLSWLMTRTVAMSADIPKATITVCTFSWFTAAVYYLALVAIGLIMGELLQLRKDEWWEVMAH